MDEVERNEREIATNETSELIASNKVDGTAVYGRDGERLGEIYNFMVGKRSGQVEYAVLKSGGLFGIGGDYYPLPWNTLTYDTDLGGYQVNIDRSQLDNAPHYGANDEPTWNSDYEQRVTDYYGSSGSL